MLFVSNLSLEYDMKKDLQERQPIFDEGEDDENEKAETLVTAPLDENDWTTIETTKRLLTHPDTALIFALSFLILQSIVVYDMWVPMVCVELMGWGVFEMNIMMIGRGVTSCLGLPKS